VLRNVPPIEDVPRAVELAQAAGALVEFHEAERTLMVDASVRGRLAWPATSHSAAGLMLGAAAGHDLHLLSGPTAWITKDLPDGSRERSGL